MTCLTTEYFLFVLVLLFVVILILTCVSIWVILKTFQLPHDIEISRPPVPHGSKVRNENELAVLGPIHFTKGKVSKESV